MSPHTAHSFDFLYGHLLFLKKNLVLMSNCLTKFSIKATLTKSSHPGNVGFKGSSSHTQNPQGFERKRCFTFIPSLGSWDSAPKTQKREKMKFLGRK